MAVYYTLAIDCGASRPAAENLRAHFSGFAIDAGRGAPLCCEASLPEDGGVQRVLVWPVGLAAGAGERGRAEWLSDAGLDRVRRALYGHLRRAGGYRLAWFGAEAQDVAFAPVPLEATLLVPGTVFRDDLSCSALLMARSAPFAAGFRWIPPDGEGHALRA